MILRKLTISSQPIHMLFLLYMLCFSTSIFGKHDLNNDEYETEFIADNLEINPQSCISKKEEKVALVEKLKNHVYKISHEIGDRSIFKYNNLNRAADYITNQLESYGYDVEFQEYEKLGRTFKNIIAVKHGNQNPDKIIIVGAHYDTDFNPGADDNASAVAGLLALAEILIHKDIKHSIKFIAFANEEMPFFQTESMGSMIYVKDAEERQENITLAIILEMIGYYSDEPGSQRFPLILSPFYPNKGNFITVVGNLASKYFVKKITSAFKEENDFPIKSTSLGNFILGADRSDHWSFWKKGYPAVMVTDTANYRNPNYHSNTDTFDTLNYESMAEVVDGFKSVLMKLATPQKN